MRVDLNKSVQRKELIEGEAGDKKISDGLQVSEIYSTDRQRAFAGSTGWDADGCRNRRVSKWRESLSEQTVCAYPQFPFKS